ncbi:MAG TPA: hypothetical protein VMZ28_24860 [Kofleriaceae bacterium]|nr:hypothetical protein [Kofleriaceae bacterium]
MRCTVALALLIALGGCKKKEEEKSKAAEPAATATPRSRERAGRTGDQPVSDRRKAGVMGARREGADRVAQLRMLPISVDEVKSAVPVLPGGKPLGPPAVAMGGRQVRASQCVTGRNTEQVAADLERVLGEQGFTNVRSKPHPRDESVILISAEKLPLRTGGSIERGDFAGCEQAKGGTKVSLSYFKRPENPTPTPAP